MSKVLADFDKAMSKIIGREAHINIGERGNIFIEGGDGRFRIRGEAVSEGGLYPKLNADDQTFKDAVARMIWEAAVLVWDHPVNWTFGVTYNTGQGAFWFTARYYDEEAEAVIVEQTLELLMEEVSQRNWDDSKAIIERQLEDLHRKCEAEIAMFE